MSKRKETKHVPDTARRVLAATGSVTSGQLARAAGVTRQAAHYHLARMAEAGELERRGAGRSTRYVATADFTRTYPIEGAAEDDIWREVRDAVACVPELGEQLLRIANYAVTEMVNNAIDHSRGNFVRVAVRCLAEAVAVEVADDGIGAFESVRRGHGLVDAFDAVQQLSKGKQTTAPERHAGEGIFFTSKAVDLFELEANGLRWVVDNRRRDQAVGTSIRETGTRVLFEIDRSSTRVLRQVFEEFTEPEELTFDRTRATVALARRGRDFVSRSEAKRLANGLERFGNVVVDFAGVDEVGQGFVDELFRVWQGAHPETRLEPINMNAAVSAMVRRGLPRG